MKTIVMASALVLLSVCGAVAADKGTPLGTTLSACDLAGQGLQIANTDGCVSVSGGVEYSLTWGDYRAGQSDGAGRRNGAARNGGAPAEAGH